jgi:putative oxidoreductase
MADTSTVQSNSTSIHSSASGAPLPSPLATANVSRGALLKKILLQQSFGLLCMRLVLGATMIAYGVPKFLGGSAYLEQVGSAMKIFGLGSGFEAFGMLAAMIEVVGGIMLILGAFYRVSCLLLAFVMVMATLFKYTALPESATSTDFIMNCLHPLSMAGVFLSILFLGPGRLSLQKE